LNRFISVLAIGAIAFLPLSVDAANPASLSATIVIFPACNITSNSQLTFTAVSGLGTVAAQTSTNAGLNVTCTGTTAGLAFTDANGTGSSFRMKGATTDYITYTLTKDSAGTQQYLTTGAANTVTVSTGNTVLNIYAQTASGTYVPDSYSDTVTATLTGQ
jgi:spore coat protein U-like protein